MLFPAREQTADSTPLTADRKQPDRHSGRYSQAAFHHATKICGLRFAVYCLLGERKRFDDAELVIYYARQHWKGGDSKYMSSNHSEVAAA